MQLLGHVAAIYRYPVKSLAGEKLDSVAIDADGAQWVETLTRSRSLSIAPRREVPMPSPSRDELAQRYLDQLPFPPYPVQEEALLTLIGDRSNKGRHGHKPPAGDLFQPFPEFFFEAHASLVASDDE